MMLKGLRWGKGLFRLWLVFSLMWMIGWGGLVVYPAVKEYRACNKREEYMKSLLKGYRVNELYKIMHPSFVLTKNDKTTKKGWRDLTPEEVDELYKGNVTDFMRSYKNYNDFQKKVFVKLDKLGAFSSIDADMQNKYLASYNYGCDAKRGDMYIFLMISTIPVIVLFILGTALIWALRGFLPESKE